MEAGDPGIRLPGGPREMTGLLDSADKSLDSGYILKIQLAGCVDGLNVEPI